MRQNVTIRDVSKGDIKSRLSLELFWIWHIHNNRFTDRFVNTYKSQSTKYQIINHCKHLFHLTLYITMIFESCLINNGFGSSWSTPQHYMLATSFFVGKRVSYQLREGINQAHFPTFINPIYCFILLSQSSMSNNYHYMNCAKAVQHYPSDNRFFNCSNVN